MNRLGGTARYFSLRTGSTNLTTYFTYALASAYHLIPMEQSLWLEDRLPYSFHRLPSHEASIGSCSLSLPFPLFTCMPHLLDTLLTTPFTLGAWSAVQPIASTRL